MAGVNLARSCDDERYKNNAWLFGNAAPWTCSNSEACQVKAGYVRARYAIDGLNLDGTCD